MELSADQRAELLGLVKGPGVSAQVATRARIVLWFAEGRAKKQVAALACVSRPTVDLWLSRYEADGVTGLVSRSTAAPREQVPASVKARVLALTRSGPPASTGLSHWSCRELSAYLKRAEGISVSFHLVAKLWREHDLTPSRSGTFKLSRDAAFATKVADVVGLYLEPPGGAIVLCIDEKTSIQALDRTQPVLPIDFSVSEKRTADYIRHGTTNLFAALEVGTGRVIGQCKPTRNGADFLAFLKHATAPYAGREIHVVLDNLSTHDTPEVKAWLAEHPNISFHFTPIGSSWLNQVEIWFGIITRQAIRRGTFTSVKALIYSIRDYITGWNSDAEPFTWTATADQILAKVAIVHTNVKQLLDNNAK